MTERRKPDPALVPRRPDHPRRDRGLTRDQTRELRQRLIDEGVIVPAERTHEREP